MSDMSTTTPYAPPAQSARVPQWTLADRLTKSRYVANLTQAELAEEMQIGVKTVIRYEAGGSTKRSTLLGWAMVCGVDPSWLLTGTTNSPDDTPTQDISTSACDGYTAEIVNFPSRFAQVAQVAA